MLKNFLTVLLCLGVSYYATAQQDSAAYYVQEGIKLHDAGKYSEAIAYYDKAINFKPDFNANYEKSYSLFVSKRYDECIELCKKLIIDYSAVPEVKNAYVNYGSALDEKGSPKEALAIYDQAIKLFPDFYLAYFNKGLTLYKAGAKDEALEAFEESARLKPLHTSSNNLISIILQYRNKIPALLANLTFLFNETQGTRAKAGVERIAKILASNVSKNDNGGIVISVNKDLLDKRKEKQDDFSTSELSLTLMAGLDNDTLFRSENEPERLSRKLQLVIGVLKNTKSGKGFYWSHYVPFFLQLKQRKYTEVASYICYASIENPQVQNWLNQNQDKVKEFYDWMNNYDWKD